MQRQGTPTRNDQVRRPVLLALAGLMVGLSLSACAPAATTTTSAGAGVSDSTTTTGTAPTTTTTDTATTGAAAGTAATATTGTAAAGTADTAAAGAAGTAPSATPRSPTYDEIVAQLTAAGQYRTFLSLLDQTDLASTLPPGGVTVFAPTDNAFYQLPSGRLPALISTAALRRQLVLNHMVQGNLSTEQIQNGTQFTTLGGGTVPVSTTSGGARLGTGNVTLTPIVTTNVTIYPIDAVLAPSGS